MITNAEGDVVGSMDNHDAAIIRDERGEVISTSRTKGGLVRQEKRTFCTGDGEVLGYISGRDVCAPNGKVLARIVNSHHFNVGTYDIVDADQRVIARGEAVAHGRKAVDPRCADRVRRESLATRPRRRHRAGSADAHHRGRPALAREGPPGALADGEQRRDLAGQATGADCPPWTYGSSARSFPAARSTTHPTTGASTRTSTSACSVAGRSSRWCPPTRRGPEWTFPVSVVSTADGVDYRGPHVQGKRGDRFIYLSWGTVDDRGTFEMFRRTKLMLAAVPDDVLDAANRPGRALVGALELTAADGSPVCAAVRPPKISWTSGAMRG